VLHGIPGIGKTQHAVQFAHKSFEYYTYVLWVSADTSATFYGSMGSLINSLPLKFFHSNSSLLGNFASVTHWLSHNEGWLLIVDNADSKESVIAVERGLPVRHGGTVIITSQNTNWTEAFQQQIIEKWDEAQAVAFLKSRLYNVPSTEQELIDLASSLYGHPLALEQAAAFIVCTRLSPHAYMRRFQVERNRLLYFKGQGMTGYRASVATTWNISIGRLTFLSRYILRIAACYSPDPIPRQILGYILARNEQYLGHGFLDIILLRRVLAAPGSIDSSLSELFGYSLISLSEDSFSVHPLLQMVLRDTVHLSFIRYFSLFLGPYFGVNFPHTREEAEAALWPSRAMMLISADGVLPTSYHSNLKDRFQLEKYIPHIEAVLRFLPDTHFCGSIPRTRLENILNCQHIETKAYDKGLAEIIAVLDSAGNFSNFLKVESAWFEEKFKDLCEQALQSGEADNSLLIQVRTFVHTDSDSKMYWAYHFVGEIAKVYLRTGDLPTARRLYEFCIQHATEHPLATYKDIGCALLNEANNLWNEIEDIEILRLLERGLGVFEGNADFSNSYILSASQIYASLAETSEQKDCAERWLRESLSFAWKLMNAGVTSGIFITARLASLLTDKGEIDEALNLCEKTLLLAIRSHRAKLFDFARVKTSLFAEVNLLWLIRGNLLKQRGDHLAAARSYSRCLALERRHHEPSVWREIDLLESTGLMFLRAGYEPAAVTRLLEAKTLLEKRWDNDRRKAEPHALIVGVFLGHTSSEGEGKMLLRQFVASASKHLDPEDPELELAKEMLTGNYCIK
jgi:tetratricopeptide (TPR) repeat protein